MPELNTKVAGTLLASTAGVDMKTVATPTIYTVPSGKTLVLTGLVVRNASASLAGGTSYSVTTAASGNWRATFSLAALTTATTGYIHVYGADLAQYTTIAATTAVRLTVTTGSTLAATATIDVYGYLF